MSACPPPHCRPPTRAPNTNGLSSPPFAFAALSQPNTSSSTSPLSSTATAEGKPIPLDDSSAAHRTTALRELNRSQPSSRRYAKNSGPPSTSTTTGTYSQPVLVRTYSGPPTTSSSKSRGTFRRVPRSAASTPPTIYSWYPKRNGKVPNMARPKGITKSSLGEDAKLPPVEAFTFKSIMADIQPDVNADLDRIAEICARSRYSLSNQYEVHMAPHGSGSGFLGAPAASYRSSALGGPTLQAIPSDDEQPGRRHPKRRGAVRRGSAAYGTLETIISSSRSSDEDKGKKKSAAELAAEVRGRSAQNYQDETTSDNSTEAQASSDPASDSKKMGRPKSTSFVSAVMDSSRGQVQSENKPPKVPSLALVSQPARPETSRGHPGIIDSAETQLAQKTSHGIEPQNPKLRFPEYIGPAAIAKPEEPRSQFNFLAPLSSWIPWMGLSSRGSVISDSKGNKTKSYAEGALRVLLESTGTTSDLKGKGVEIS